MRIIDCLFRRIEELNKQSNKSLQYSQILSTLISFRCISYHPSHLKSPTMRDLLAWITNLIKHWCLSNKAEKTARLLGRKARQNMKRGQILADNDIGWFQRKQPSLNFEFTSGGIPGNSWWGCAARFLKSWPNFRQKNVIFHTRFQTRPLKSIPVFRPGR